jgi:hypothetical protein
MKGLRDGAWDLVNPTDTLTDASNNIKSFRKWVFEVIWYIPWLNEADLVEYLKKYREHSNLILTKWKRVSNDDVYNTKASEVA